MLTYVSSQFVAGGKAFNAHLGISEQSGLLITALIILIYTILGGFLAVSLTDVFQAVVMLLALIGLPLIGIIGNGGMHSTITQLKHIDSDMLNLFRQPALAIIGLAGIGLGSPGNPHIIIRYMSIKDQTQFRWTAVTGTIWNVIMAAGAIGIGLVGRTYFPDAGLLPEGDQENIYVSLANVLMNPFLAGLIIASVFAAIMSTADSQLLIAASSIVRDIYEKIIRRGTDIPQQQLTLLSDTVLFHRGTDTLVRTVRMGRSGCCNRTYITTGIVLEENHEGRGHRRINHRKCHGFYLEILRCIKCVII